jgi:hypothetical protein
MAFAEDLSVYFDTLNGFAEAVQVNGLPVNAIVDLPSKDSALSEDFEPAIHCQFSDVDPVAQGDPVVVRSVNYQVTNIDQDETGLLVVLFLEAV